MRLVTHGVLAVFALVIGLGIGYLMWGLQSADLTRQMQQERSEFDYKISEAERRAKAAEERARQESQTRKVFEEELNRVYPQK
ncbi:MAG TPA: hypothetical protein VLT62_11930 [Candidatus Methylomirabilis sp.]|nr:hypothetical protein [Candidatus Methylomirabilis sp.]HSB77759.1 hypothetical protein [Candidatus Methylomirabilis sp.]